MLKKLHPSTVRLCLCSLSSTLLPLYLTLGILFLHTLMSLLSIFPYTCLQDNLLKLLIQIMQQLSGIPIGHAQQTEQVSPRGVRESFPGTAMLQCTRVL